MIKVVVPEDRREEILRDLGESHIRPFSIEGCVLHFMGLTPSIEAQLRKMGCKITRSSGEAFH